MGPWPQPSQEARTQAAQALLHAEGIFQYLASTPLTEH